MSVKIKDGFFIGDVDSAQDNEFIGVNSISTIINCCAHEVPCIFLDSGIKYYSLNMEESPSHSFFDIENSVLFKIFDIIENCVNSCNCILVHSMEGISRSPCIVLAYLMLKYSWGVNKAFEFLKSKRQDIRPHPKYMNQLYTLDAQLLKKYSGSVCKHRLEEWTLDFIDKSTDEGLLIRTFLNSRVDEKYKLSNSYDILDKCSHDRSLAWIDEKSNIHGHSVLERPPTPSYSSFELGSDWVDTYSRTPKKSSDESNRRDQKKLEIRPILKEEALNVLDEEIAISNNSDGEDSWDLSYSNPSVNHDQDRTFKPAKSPQHNISSLSILVDLAGGKAVDIADTDENERNNSITNGDTTYLPLEKVKEEPTSQDLIKKLNYQIDSKKSSLSNNISRKKREIAGGNELELSENKGKNIPRYLQHTLSSKRGRNFAKNFKTNIQLTSMKYNESSNRSRKAALSDSKSPSSSIGNNYSKIGVSRPFSNNQRYEEINFDLHSRKNSSVLVPKKPTSKERVGNRMDRRCSTPVSQSESNSKTKFSRNNNADCLGNYESISYRDVESGKTQHLSTILGSKPRRSMHDHLHNRMVEFTNQSMNSNNNNDRPSNIVGNSKYIPSVNPKHGIKSFNQRSKRRPVVVQVPQKWR